MPKLINQILAIAVAIIFLSNLAPVRANMDPQSATSSATATVPSSSGTTSDTTAPSSPILVSPPDGSHTGDSTPEFVWRLSTDQDSNNVTYNLFVNGVATYLGVSSLGNSAGAGYTAQVDGNEIKLLPTTGYSDGQYSWYVTATDNSGNTSFSATWSFTIDTQAPSIKITDIDVYHNLNLSSDNPENFDGANFDINGPKDVYFTIHAESWSTITIKIMESGNQVVSTTTWPVNGSGIVYPFMHLRPGVYLVYVSDFDRGGNTTALPEFTLTINQASITITTPSLPGSSPTTIITIPYSPISLPSLPATIAKITTRSSLSTLYIILLAVAISILIILIWKRKVNLVLLSPDGRAIPTATVYHSIPSRKSSSSQILVTNREPLLYDLRAVNQGKLYIPRLTRYSTLTIRTESQTLVLSICRHRSIYTIVC